MKTQKSGDIAKVEIRDYTYRLLHRRQYNLSDKNSVLNMLRDLIKYCGHILDIIKERLIDGWI